MDEAKISSYNLYKLLFYNRILNLYITRKKTIHLFYTHTFQSF